MSSYVLKVTGKIGLDENGEKANLLVFAYKPFNLSMFDTELEKKNNQMYRESGCYNADRYVKTGKTFTGRIMENEGGPSIAWSAGTILDTQFDKVWDNQNNNKN